MAAYQVAIYVADNGTDENGHTKGTHLMYVDLEAESPLDALTMFERECIKDGWIRIDEERMSHAINLAHVIRYYAHRKPEPPITTF